MLYYHGYSMKKIKTKSLYTRNRLKDIREMKEQLNQKYEVDIHYKYVPSSDNPADLLYRGITLKKIIKSLNYLTHGPSWLVEEPGKWPTSSLSCLSQENKCHVKNVFSNILVETVNKSLIPFYKFSDFNKLRKANAFIFKFITRANVKRNYLIPNIPHELRVDGSVENKYESISGWEFYC